ncbi:MAG: transglutaminase family protein [Fusicatenibacter sp.]|nr:transglutaminase family protein [Fusicatenibacter sp.]
MKELHFEYSMKLEFETPVEKHRFTLKCVPRSDKRQKILDLNIDVYPKEFLSTDEDSFGNQCIYGYSEGFHDHFSVSLSGRALCGLSSCEDDAKEARIGLFRYQSEYTKPGPEITAFTNSIQVEDTASDLDRAIHYMKALYGRFSYVPRVTTINTTAEEAFAGGCGVCQDYSHILLSMCRMRQIPCRYVVGMLMGEGESHAWVEICQNGVWIPLDPTNNLIVEDQHIKISSGRDYKDCLVNQGIFMGQTLQRQKVYVLVREERM